LSVVAATKGPSERGWPAMTFVLLLVVVAAIYGRALRAPFIFDDRPAVVENPSLRRLWPLVGTAAERGPLNPPPLAPTGRRPLANFTLALDYAWAGLDPTAFRVTNLVLHALSAAVLAALVRRTLLLPYFGAAGAALAWPASVAAALVWATHPLVTETVVYVTQRTELLAALAYLATLWAAVRYWTAATDPARQAWLVVAVTVCAAGMASKEVAASAPLAVLLYERTFLVDSWRAVRRSWPLHAGLALTWLVLFALNVGGASGLSDARHYVPPPVWWATQCKVLFLYLRLVVWPWPLAVHYAPAYLATVASAAPWIVATAGLGATVAVLVWRRPAARFVVVATALVLAPTWIIPIAKMMAAERRMYLPLAGLVALAVVGAWRRGVPRVSHGVAFAGVLGLVVVLALVSRARLSAYASVVSLWRETVRQQPADALAHYNLGVGLLDAGSRPAEAMAEFEEALRLDPDHDDALDNLGLVLFRLGRYGEARERFARALALDPDNAVAHNNMAALLLEERRPADAIPHLERALAAEPDLPKATTERNLGRALVAVGRGDEGLAHLDAAVRLDPNDVEALNDRGAALLGLGRPADAIPSFEAALRRAPTDRASTNNLATALLQTGRPGDAVALLQKLVAAEPDNLGARNNLGSALSALGRRDEAIAQFTAVLARAPDHPTAHYNLGSALLESGRAAEAVPHFEVMMRHDPEDARARFKCAQAYVASARRAEGLALVDAALGLARKHHDAALAGEIASWRLAQGAAPDA
jgi:tetratricopeptide (TPR) repeat protein